MRFLKTQWCCTIALVVLSTCSSWAEAAEQQWKAISPQELKQLISSQKKPILINTMSSLECRDHSIPESLCIPSEEFEKKISHLKAGKADLLVLYCESEGSFRSCEAADAAIRKGYTNVMALKGGIPAWKQAGYEMASTERIPRTAIPSVKPPVLKQWLMEKRNFLLVDIRPEKAFQQGHIEGAINIPMYQLHLRYGDLPLNRPLILVDNRGFRSSLAGSYLIVKGFEVKMLFGGMAKWEDMVAKEKQTQK
ncbi:MAG: rhodanese-like domain-containing protein [Deltaproteobacteria bacterium]|nr:rhodanese-like domain-containing protein [Deltaproteobacteria bacterium]